MRAVQAAQMLRRSRPPYSPQTVDPAKGHSPRGLPSKGGDHGVEPRKARVARVAGGVARVALLGDDRELEQAEHLVPQHVAHVAAGSTPVGRNEFPA